jgi:hypothetical protein
VPRLTKHHHPLHPPHPHPRPHRRRRHHRHLYARPACVACGWSPLRRPSPSAFSPASCCRYHPTPSMSHVSFVSFVSFFVFQMFSNILEVCLTDDLDARVVLCCSFTRSPLRVCPCSARYLAWCCRPTPFAPSASRTNIHLSQAATQLPVPLSSSLSLSHFDSSLILP